MVVGDLSIITRFMSIEPLAL